MENNFNFIIIIILMHYFHNSVNVFIKIKSMCGYFY